MRLGEVEARMDPQIPNKRKYEVYKNYTIKLIQHCLSFPRSDDKFRSSKFYHIQLLIDKNKYLSLFSLYIVYLFIYLINVVVLYILITLIYYYVWTRWGRVGAEGMHKMSIYDSEAKGIKDFEKKFKDKTANSWNDISNFTSKRGKYLLAEPKEQDWDTVFTKVNYILLFIIWLYSD